MPIRKGGGGGGGGGTRVTLVVRDDRPMRGPGATLQLAPGNYEYIECSALWFYGGLTDFAYSAGIFYSGISNGRYLSDAGGSSWADSENAQGYWAHTIQPDLIPPATTYAIALLARTITSGWSIEFDPDTFVITLVEYADTGAGIHGNPMIQNLHISAVEV